MNKQELAANIWAGANALRGKVSAGAYKDYMLGFIFYKYLSEKEERYLREKLFFEDADFADLKEEEEIDDSVRDTIKNCEENLGYFIETKNLFSYWTKQGTDFTIKDVREAISAFNRHIGKNYKKVYEEIFNTLNNGLNDFGASDAERSKAIRSLTDLIRKIPVDGKQDYDVLGFVYEFLLKNFAANAGKAGEFYTPYEASVIMSEIIADHLKDRSEISIYDPTSGSGSLLLNIGRSVSQYMEGSNRVKYYAQELIPDTYNLTRMNLVMRDILPDNIIVRNGDTLADDWPFFDDTDRERTYDPVFVDGCCSNPPYSQPWHNEDAGTDVRFSDYGIAPKTKADYAFLLHNLYHLKPDGIMTIVLPHGVLFRGGDEETIRTNLVDKNNIETIIGLPANMFFGTGIPTIIMVLKKKRDIGDILIVDASKGFAKDGNKNRLRAKDVRKIVDTVLGRKTIPGFSRLVSKAEVEANGYNLNIPRYVDSSDKGETWDLFSIMEGGIPKKELEDFEAIWQTFPSLKSELFKDSGTPYMIPKSDSIKETVLNNAEVIRFLQNYSASLADIPAYLERALIDGYRDVAVAKHERLIAEKLREKLSSESLVDYYDAYQVLDDEWTVISLDLEIMQEHGFEAVRKVDPYYVQKKDPKTKELVEKQEGYVGRILPIDLVQSVFFADEKKEIEGLSSELECCVSEKDELLESIDPNDKADLLDNEEIDKKKLQAKIKEIKKQLKDGAEFDEDQYESIILKIDALDTKMKALKTNIKSKKAIIENETIAKYDALTDEEARMMLQQKWIDPLYDRLISLASESIKSYASQIDAVKSKYDITLNDVDKEINETEQVLCAMFDDLTGDLFDMKGLESIKALING